MSFRGVAVRLMAVTDGRRLNMVMEYLHPDLDGRPFHDGEHSPELSDYLLQNDSDGTGTYLIWQNDSIPEPTAQEIADAKEAAMNAHWFKTLRMFRSRLLKESDWSQGADVPSNLKEAYTTYRTDLRDLPATATKPSFETLNSQYLNEWIENIKSIMPTEPTV